MLRVINRSARRSFSAQGVFSKNVFDTIDMKARKTIYHFNYSDDAHS